MYDLMLFALEGSHDFGAAVAAHLGIPLSLHEELEFEDGEHKARPLVSVRGGDIYVIHSLYADHRHSGNDKLCRLLFFIGALKDAAAGHVTAVVPYLAYAREDQKSALRDPVTTRYVAALFEAVGADAVVAMDVHNLAAFQNAFRCRTEHLVARPLFIKHFGSLLRDEAVTVVSPDAGGIKRAEQFRQAMMSSLGRPVAAAFAEKHRRNGALSGDMLAGDVRGRHAIIIDDLVSTGSTLVRTAQACLRHGASAVTAAATHGIFAGDADRILSDPALAHIIVTDTVSPACQRIEHFGAKLTRLDSTGLFAEAIRRMHAGDSLADMV